MKHMTDCTHEVDMSDQELREKLARKYVEADRFGDMPLPKTKEELEDRLTIEEWQAFREGWLAARANPQLYEKRLLTENKELLVEAFAKGINNNFKTIYSLMK